MNNKGHLRDKFYEAFPAFKNRAYTEDTAKVIADWWLSKYDTLLSELREKVEEISHMCDDPYVCGCDEIKRDILTLINK